MLIVEPTTLEHIKELAETAQTIDKESIRLLTGETPLQGLISSVSHSLSSETYLLDGLVAAIAGVSKASLLSNWACPWLIASDVIQTVPIKFWKLSKTWVMDELEQHGILSNFVYIEHDRSIRWLKRLGFTLEPPQPIGPYGALFMRNELRWDNQR